MPAGQLPDKLFFRIGEVAGIVGVEPHVLRYWESEFKAIQPEKSRRGQRVYSRQDVDTLLRVKDLLYGHRYTIAGARKKLRAGGVEPSDPDDPARRELTRIRTQMVELRQDLLSAIDELDRLASPGRAAEPDA
ncbi:MAG: MerR family transcriptional regulator [Myxococcota bacterium]